MLVIKTIKELKKYRQELKQASKSLALVPTMGALHEGHLSLVRLAQKEADIIGLSIFINPLQFGVGEDFSKYPRDLEADLDKLKALDVDFVFCPSLIEMNVSSAKVLKADPKLSQVLCGLYREGHFDGVVTIVNYLFELVEPDCAVLTESLSSSAAFDYRRDD